jgi:hypothetical protein
MEKKRPITYYWGAGALDSLADTLLAAKEETGMPKET